MLTAPAPRSSPALNVLEFELLLPRPRDEVFKFFAEAANLQEITPEWLDFSVTTPAPVRMQVGTLIDYRLRIHGVPVRWQSEITAWEPPARFEDTQRRGPYRVWIHEHLFEDKNGSTLVKDRLRYAAPGGKIIDWLFVRRDVLKIFNYRREKLLKLFG